MFLHSKLVKKKKSSLLVEWSTHPRTSFFKRKMVSLSWVTCLSFFFFKENWIIFTGDLPTLTQLGLFSGVTCPYTHAGLFSRATSPHTFTLVYFQGWPAHTLLPWFIFTGDLPTHTHIGLFSRMTCPFDWVNLRSHLAISFNQNQS
jgi:hypothetical protein